MESVASAYMIDLYAIISTASAVDAAMCYVYIVEWYHDMSTKSFYLFYTCNLCIMWVVAFDVLFAPPRRLYFRRHFTNSVEKWKIIRGGNPTLRYGSG